MASRTTLQPSLATALAGWTTRPLPPREVIEGSYCRLDPLDPANHNDDLVEAFAATDPASWTYLFQGPFSSGPEIRDYLVEAAQAPGFMFYAIIDKATGRAEGVAAYMRADPANGVIEIGSIHYSDRLKRSRVTTEAMFLFARHVFDDLGYRRYEWKCDSLNAPSRKTAARLGFQFEGIFRQHMVVKGRSRDTAWFAIIDKDWPALKAAYEAWLSPENFSMDGRQRRSLGDLIAEATAK